MPSFPNCTSDFTYFDSPDFLALALHIVSIISTPIYCLGVYCILFKTPKQMKSVKWNLFLVHFWIILFDYAVTELTVPYLLLPTVGGIPYGLLRTLGVPTEIQTLIVMLNLTFIFMGTLSVYENRFFILCDFGWKEKWRFWRKYWMLLHYALLVILFIPVYFLVPDQELALQEAFLELPCLPEDIYNAPIFILATHYAYHLSAAFAASIECVSQIAFYITKLIRNGREKRKSMSKRTFKMHKQFILALIIQLTVPLVLLAFPVLYTFISLLNDYHNQAIINICIIVATTHGLVSTVVMIIVHNPYRLAVIRMIRREKKVKVSVLNILQKSPVMSIN